MIAILMTHEELIRLMDERIKAALQEQEASPFVSEDEVKRMLGGISTTTMWRMRNDGRLPEPIRGRKGKNMYNLRQVEQRLAQNQEL